jgi:hypothetical protein
VLLQNKSLSRSLPTKEQTLNVDSLVDSEGQRMPQRANHKYHEDALKKRKVQLPEVLEIAELIRYKMIAKKQGLE